MLAAAAAAVAGILAVKKWQETAVEKSVWKSATDKVD
nr:DLW-39 family protein [Arthrobacter sp. zg-Y820]